MTHKIRNKVMLVIMDGWGWREEREGNAIRVAGTPNLDAFKARYPFTLLEASGESVGLPKGQMGNSEVGHLNLGAGRIVYQDLTRINKAIADQSFYENPVLKQAMTCSDTVHLFGLVSKGGVHSDFEHLKALIRMAKLLGVKKLLIHAFLDGRDMPPTSGAEFVAELMEYLKENGTGEIATIIGRYYAMDRDRRWDRVKIAYDALVYGTGRKARDPVAAVYDSYRANETDEFIRPIIMDGTSRVKDGDSVIFFNFRADRARELTRVFTQRDFKEFAQDMRPRLASFVTMTMYDEAFHLPVAFPPERLRNVLGEVVSRLGLIQLRIAETEKYAHVTYFFNGGEEEPFQGEDRKLIPSPRDVATYDQKPEMSAELIRDELLGLIARRDYDLVVVNFANGDMVGHTGVMDAAVAACKVVDACVGAIVKAWGAKGGVSLITADHGNVEKMVDENGGPFTAHTSSPVPLYLVDPERVGIRLRKGKLGDVAPTILEIMGIETPEEMTGSVLFS